MKEGKQENESHTSFVDSYVIMYPLYVIMYVSKYVLSNFVDLFMNASWKNSYLWAKMKKETTTPKTLPVRPFSLSSPLASLGRELDYNIRRGDT